MVVVRSDATAAVRVDRYIRRPAEGLDDLEQDPDELNNLALDLQHRTVKGALRKELQAWTEQQGNRGMGTEMETESHQQRQVPE